MGEVRSSGQGLQLVMPEWQPCVADQLAPGISTLLGPPLTLQYNDKKASHLDIMEAYWCHGVQKIGTS